MLYSDLSIPVRCLIILGLFLEGCAAGYLAVSTSRRMSMSRKAALILSALASVGLTIIYTAEARAKLRNLPIPAVSVWLCEQSILLPMALILAVGIYFGFLFAEELRFHRQTITRSSIKEGVDRISSGLCFYMDGGKVILCNSRMNDLCHTIAGCDLQDAEKFWQILSGGEVESDVLLLSFGSYPNFRLADGSVWTFSREELDGFIQLTAANTTQQQNVADELREKNLDLAALNLRLRRHSENVDELARSKERLETKVRIHNDLGQALVATRRYLLDQSAQEPPLHIWRSNIAMLRKEMATQKAEDPMGILQKAAKSAGVKLVIRGKLQADAEYRRLFLLAASEAMTNAVIHAGARTLAIDLSEEDTHWQMRFTNDGIQPTGPITEGGGLGSLRCRAEEMGAQMTIQSDPEFVLDIKGRKE